MGVRRAIGGHYGVRGKRGNIVGAWGQWGMSLQEAGGNREPLWSLGAKKGLVGKRGSLQGFGTTG